MPATRSMPARSEVQLWRVFEVRLDGPSWRSDGNPFDTDLFAIFHCELTGEFRRVRGFFDGGTVYRVRFQPSRLGLWSFVTQCSSAASLDGHVGNFTTVPQASGEHGPVRADGRTLPDMVFATRNKMRVPRGARWH